MAPWRHLARRFAGSLVPGGPRRRDDAWARAALLPGERALWEQMSGADRRHAVGVARRVRASLGERATRPVVAAALLHDVGKIESGFGPWRRAAASAAVAAAGYQRARAWRSQRGFRGRLGRYVCHDAIGAEMLQAAGSEELTVRWTRQHHLPPHRWTVSRSLGEALKAADDD